MVLLVTGAITPQKGVSDIVISETNERQKQYLDALEKCLNTKGIDKIVYCDNSNPDKILFVDLLKKADELGKKLEILLFRGNDELAGKKGKGYGEGEITEYAINNSKLLSDDTYFCKLTGRLYVDNLSRIVKCLNKQRCYINYPNKTIPNICDTRFYAMPIGMYNDLFSKAYLKVDDITGYFLEHAFRDVIKENNLITYNFPKYPRYRGLSASTGAVYTYKWYKCIFKDILSVFQVYRLRLEDENETVENAETEEFKTVADAETEGTKTVADTETEEIKTVSDAETEETKTVADTEMEETKIVSDTETDSDAKTETEDNEK